MLVRTLAHHLARVPCLRFIVVLARFVELALFFAGKLTFNVGFFECGAFLRADNLARRHHKKHQKGKRYTDDLFHHHQFEWQT